MKQEQTVPWEGRKDFLASMVSGYATVPEEELEKLAQRMRVRQVVGREFLAHPGFRQDTLDLVHTGIFRAYCLDAKGLEHTLAFRAAGQFLAAYSPFVADELWYAIQALSEGEVFTIPLADFHELADGHPCWQVFAEKYMAGVLAEKETRERFLLLEDPTARYISFRRNYPHIEPEASQYQVASYLGISPVSLGRIRSALRQVGLS